LDEQELRSLVGRRIRAERKAAGYDRLEDFAGRIGMDSSNLSRLEQGKRGIDSVTLMHIADTLGVRMDALFDRDREGVVAFARTGSRGRDEVVDWALGLLADMKFAEAAVARHGW
jgi:transcriptional regulator with XRE-family HTH domain